jgi:hypothetical protein
MNQHLQTEQSHDMKHMKIFCLPIILNGAKRSEEPFSIKEWILRPDKKRRSSE